MNQNDYLRLKAKLDTEYQGKLRALDQVWAMDNDGTPPPKSIDSHSDAVNSVRGFWRQVAHQVVHEMPIGNTFTVKDIQNAIAAKNPAIETDAVGISIYMKKLVGDKELKIIEQGAGRRATIYAKK